MENFKQIEKCDVWAHLQAGKKVYAVVFRSCKYSEGLRRLWCKWTVDEIRELLARIETGKEKNIVFYEEIEKGA